MYLRFLFVLLLIGCINKGAQSQIGFGIASDGQLTAVAPTNAQACEELFAQMGISACWRTDGFGPRLLEPYPSGGVPWGGLSGFPMNVSLSYGMAPGDYPPVGGTPQESTSAIVPASQARYLGPSSYQSRALLDGKVDPITGSPLLTYTDFSLPLGSAVFRHTRAYAHASSLIWHEAEGPPNGSPNDPRTIESRDGKFLNDELFWDWHGQGWTTGSNPLFLFDASYWGVITKVSQNNTRTPVRCYFVPDAHHSIPFERTTQLDESGRPLYVAPPQFDAMMLVRDGVWSVSEQSWTTLPTRVDVWLHGRSVRYSIRVIPENVPHTFTNGYEPLINKHLQPWGESGPSLGIPYLGLCDEISDRYGNRAVFEFTPQTYKQFGGELYAAYCVPCHQNCHELGQLRTAKLYIAGQTQAKWTLVYVHRNFAENRYWRTLPENYVYSVPFVSPIPEDNTTYRYSRQSAISEILVYDGDRNITSAPLTIEYSAFQQATSQVENADSYAEIVDAYETVHATNHVSLPLDWKLRSSYVYAEPTTEAEQGEEPFRAANTDFQNVAVEHDAYGSPRLVKVSVDDRRAPTPIVNDTILNYSRLKDCQNTAFDQTVLAAVYEQNNISSILKAIEDLPSHHELLEVLGPGPYNSNTLLKFHGAWTLPFAIRDDEGTIVGHTARRFDRSSATNFCYYSDRRGHTTSYTGFTPLREFVHVHLGLSDITRLLEMREGVLTYSTPDFSTGIERATSIHRFLYRPENLSASHNAVTVADFSAPQVCRALLHHPYRYIELPEHLSDTSKWHETDPNQQNEPFWIAVIVQSNVNFPTRPDGTVVAPRGKHNSLRLVALNRAGQLIDDMNFEVDDEWNIKDNGAGTLRTTKVIGTSGEVLMLKSEGYNSADAGVLGRNHHGLIQVFGYNYVAGQGFPAGMSLAGKQVPLLAWEGYKRGDQGQVYLTRRLTYDPNRPETLILDERFPQATTSGSPSPSNSEYTQINEYFDPAQVEVGYPEVNSDGSMRNFWEAGPEILVGRRWICAPISSAPGEPARHPVRTEYYDAQSGRVVWTSEGLLQSPSGNPTAGDSLRWTKHNYDVSNRLTSIIYDSASPHSNGRHSSWAPPIARISTMEYPAGPGDIPAVVTHSDGSMSIELSRPVIGDPDLTRETLSIDRAVMINSAIVVPGYATRTRYRYNIIHRTDTVHISGMQTAQSWPSTIEVRSTKLPQLDGLGRLSGSEIQFPGEPTPACLSVTFDSFGNLSRSCDSAGEIVRTQRNARGQVERVFRGTNDQHEVWGTTAPVDGENLCTHIYPDNLAQVEKYTYGVGESNAALVTLRRYYNRPVANRYNIIDCVGTPANDEDSHGRIESLGYDWRRRLVWIESVPDGSSSPSRIIATWHDDLGRVRFTAVYSPDFAEIPDTWPGDPRKLSAASSFPTAAELLAAKPMSLTETLYDRAGNVQEVRRFDCKNEAVRYTSTCTYYDDRGNLRYSTAPNAGYSTFTYDAVNRLVSESRFAAGVEISCTNYEHDASDNVTTRTALERRHDATGSILTNSNSVAVRTFQWFDEANRITAVADIGTAHQSNLFASGTLPSRPNPPMYASGSVSHPSGLEHALVTITQYDQYGRRSLFVDEAGIAKRFWYDQRDRVIAVCDNADGQSHRRTTAYAYDTSDNLIAIGTTATDVPCDSEFNWSASDGSVQITSIGYGGGIVDENAVAFPQSLIATKRISYIRYPHPVTGQPDTAREVTCEYQLDNHRLLNRSAPASAISYVYDDRGNITQIQTAGGILAGAPDSPITAHAVTISVYDALDRLVATGVHSRNTSGQISERNTTSFSYDGFGDITQAGLVRHGTHALDLDEYIEYQREWSDAAHSSRLASITYPKRTENTQGENTVLAFEYGATNSISDALSYTTAVHNISNPGQAYTLVAWNRTGLGRVVSEHRCFQSGSSSATSRWSALDSNNVYSGLDRFGRVQSKHWRDALSRDQYGYTITYDNSGRVTSSTLTRAWGIHPLNRRLLPDRGRTVTTNSINLHIPDRARLTPKGQ